MLMPELEIGGVCAHFESVGRRNCIPIIEHRDPETGLGGYLAVSLEDPEGALLDVSYVAEDPHQRSSLTLIDWLELMCEDLETHEYPRFSLEAPLEWTLLSQPVAKQDLVALPEGTAFLVKERRRTKRRPWALHGKMTPEHWATVYVNADAVTEDPDPHKIEFHDDAARIATTRLRCETRRAPELWRKTDEALAVSLKVPCDWMWQGMLTIKRP
ncbi:hypothetical protein JY651_22230 [Pyxidicoccus parkwayensis]|uniref:Uncharacterized protein n=1 Tax=Pyxidicoccus parkwayensis TaxID=2813578 RepID=A0ABX7PAG4_9BACT|nr:hypothetical protein [Pyxidicoccus parkwaysis]QSQ27461.1 hypothetical protein JY651_22230 [Pyxidicoccus parkwaysis]